MKKYVLTIDEATCSKNNKDVNAKELLNVMGHYGTVENYETVEARVVAEHQKVNAELHAQLNAIKDQELTVDEIKMVKAYRENKSAVVADCEKKLNAMAETLRLGNEKLAQAKAVISAQLEKLGEE